MLFWYLDHFLPSNRGAAMKFYFPLTPSYWISMFPCFERIACKCCKITYSTELPPMKGFEEDAQAD